jgi:hypothetical protein
VFDGEERHGVVESRHSPVDSGQNRVSATWIDR